MIEMKNPAAFFLARRRSLAWMLALAGLLALAPMRGAQAQSCWASAYGLSFGTVSPPAAADASTTVPYTCQGGSSTTYFKLCFFVNLGGQSTSANPRRMINYSTSTYLNYLLFADAARTQIVGPPGGGFPTYTWNLTVPANTQTSPGLPLYGRVPAGQSAAAGSYQEQGTGGVLRYAWSTTATPASCSDAGSTDVTTGHSGTTATVSNSCTIAIASATDLNFGSVASLASAIDQTSTISLSCPGNTSWKLGLNNGANASGIQRRMTDGANHYVDYELYRDAGRTQRWGNDIANGTDTVNGSGTGQTNPTVLTVHGRVPAQAAKPPGAYADTITVTLTY